MTFCLASGHAAVTTPDKEKRKSDQIAHPKVSMMFGSDLSTPKKPHALQGQGELKKKLVVNDCFFVLFCFFTTLQEYDPFIPRSDKFHA